MIVERRRVPSFLSCELPHSAFPHCFFPTSTLPFARRRPVFPRRRRKPRLLPRRRHARPHRPPRRRQLEEEACPGQGILSRSPHRLARLSHARSHQKGLRRTCDEVFQIGQVPPGLVRPSVQCFASWSNCHWCRYPCRGGPESPCHNAYKLGSTDFPPDMVAPLPRDFHCRCTLASPWPYRIFRRGEWLRVCTGRSIGTDHYLHPSPCPNNERVIGILGNYDHADQYHHRAPNYRWPDRSIVVGQCAVLR